MLQPPHVISFSPWGPPLLAHRRLAHWAGVFEIAGLSRSRSQDTMTRPAPKPTGKERRDPRTRGSTAHPPTAHGRALRFPTTICIVAPWAHRPCWAGWTNRSHHVAHPSPPGMRTLQHASSKRHPVSDSCPPELKVQPTPTSQRLCQQQTSAWAERARNNGPCPTTA